jgi:predicted oxidoreductase
MIPARMEFAPLGRTGLKVSRICLGVMTHGDPGWRSWVLPEQEGRPFIQRALELGINFFDTADMYSRGVSEEILGRALKDFAARRTRPGARRPRILRESCTAWTRTMTWPIASRRSPARGV